MCWKTDEKLRYRKVNHAFPVFKVGYVRLKKFYSSVYGYPYKINELQSKIALSQKKVYGNNKDSYIIENGYHSYSQVLKLGHRGTREIDVLKNNDVVDCDYLNENTRIGIFEIPSGTRFIVNKDGLVVSDNIVLKKIVTVDEFIKNGVLA